MEATNLLSKCHQASVKCFDFSEDQNTIFHNTQLRNIIPVDEVFHVYHKSELLTITITKQKENHSWSPRYRKSEGSEHR